MAEKRELDDFNIRGDMLEYQQLTFRTRTRIAERRMRCGDIIICNCLLMTGSETYAEELQVLLAASTSTSTPLPLLRSVRAVVADVEENAEALQEVAKDVSTMQRVDKANTEYWKYVGLLVETLMEDDEDDNGGSVSEGIHPSVYEEVRKFVSDCVEPEVCYVASSQPALKDIPFWREVRHLLGIHIATKFLDGFHAKQKEVYDTTLDKFNLRRLIPKVTDRITGEGNAVPQVDPRLLKGTSHDVATQKANGLLQILQSQLLHDEVLVTQDLPQDRHMAPGLRKPDFVCRVAYGFDWNRYNATHYNQENLPPKQVKGYKFDVFYPDLPRDVKPKYQIVAKSEDSETAILKFVAGPPYGELWFEIVNRPWNRNIQKGYRCVMENGVFSLHFHFAYVRNRRY